VKDYNSAVDYQDPPPAYRNSSAKMSPMVQTAKIIAMAAVAIAGMLSFAIVFAAWLNSSTNAACQYQASTIETIIPPQALKSMLMGANDLDSAESKVESNKKDSSEEERDNNSGEDAVTMFKLPVELSLQEHMFERNQRSHMNCIIEKKKAEEIVDEQAKPLPPLLGINISTDPRYLHFTGEKMAISCDSGNDHRQAPPLPLMHMDGPPMHPPMGMPSGSGNIPIHIIGPIPLGQLGHHEPHPMGMGMGMHPPQQSNLVPIIIPQSSEEGQIFVPPPQHFAPVQVPHQQVPHSNEIRERALHHPIPIMPRQHVQHVIRPRSTDAVEKKRVKRCSCDCACKNPHD